MAPRSIVSKESLLVKPLKMSAPAPCHHIFFKYSIFHVSSHDDTGGSAANYLDTVLKGNLLN